VPQDDLSVELVAAARSSVIVDRVSTTVAIVVLILIAIGMLWMVRQKAARKLEDARWDARRRVERLGGQVLNLVGTDDASKQAMADAAERFNAAGAQLEQVRSIAQAKQVIQTAGEGLHHIRIARKAMGLDPGPADVVGVLSHWRATRKLADARSQARRWVERLGAQVLHLVGTDDLSKQALADAAERYSTASALLEHARRPAHAREAANIALEGLYYSRAARTTMGLDAGPVLPRLVDQLLAGTISTECNVDVGGRAFSASPAPSQRHRHYFPGGTVAGQRVPAGWYSESVAAVRGASVPFRQRLRLRR
jgi:hypothetical protein